MSEASGLTLADLTIREMVNRDLADVLVIERNVHVSPWSRLSFEESLTRSEESSTQGKESSTQPKESSTRGKESSTRGRESAAPYYCRVIEHNNTILGYYVVSTVVDELHVLNVVVAKQVQGSGLGHVLMKDIEQLAENQGLRKVFLEVRASNEPAKGLYRKWQFQQIAVRKGYYSANVIGKSAGAKESAPSTQEMREDALVFVREL